MKKIIIVLMSLLLIFTLGACGNKDKSNDNKVSNNSGSSGNDSVKVDFNVPKVDESKKLSDLQITSMKLDKDVYEQGEQIIVTLTYKGTPLEDAWVGIVPAEIEHGDEYLNDDYDVDYYYILSKEPGEEFVFETWLEPGDYSMRINENDNGGIELGWLDFKVKGDKTSTDNTSINTDTNIDDSSDANTDNDGKCTSWGGVIYYDVEKWQEDNMGLVSKDSDSKIVFMPYGYTVDELLQNKKNNATEIELEEDIEVNGLSGKKMIYTSGWSPDETKMCVIIDTAFIGDSMSTVFNIELSVKKDSEDVALLEDPAIWEMINSFNYGE